MEPTGGQYVWQLGPRWVRRIVGGSLLAIVALGVLIGGIAAAAQSAAAVAYESQGFGMERFSLTLHVVAMTALSGLAVGVATALTRLGRVELAGVVLLATVAGPMTLVAAPVRASLVDVDTSDTKLWWHLVVGGSVLAVLAGWTWFSNRCLAERDTAQARKEPSTPFQWLVPDLVFLTAGALGAFTYAQLPGQTNTPSIAAVMGWVVLAAGMTVVVACGPRWWGALVAFGCAVTVLTLVFLAYTRLGGWPGVAGWEGADNVGIQSPIITSVASTVTLLAAGFLGLALRPLVQSVRIRLAASTGKAALAH